MADHAIYKYTDKDGKVKYTDAPPDLANAKVMTFNANTVGWAQTRQSGGGSGGEQSEATKQRNAELRALTADANAKKKVLDEKINEFGAAANKVNARRELLYSEIKRSNEGLESLDKAQDRSGYAIAALSIIGTGILLVATAPAAVIVGGVLVVGTAAAGAINDGFRPENETLNKDADVERLEKGSEAYHRLGEVGHMGERALEAEKLIAEGGTKLAPLAGKTLPVVGAVVTGVSAYHTAESTVANQVGGGADLNSASGLENLHEKVEEFKPSFSERNFAGFDKDKLLKEIEETKEAQEEYDKAVCEEKEAAEAFLAAMHALNDTYSDRKGK